MDKAESASVLKSQDRVVSHSPESLSSTVTVGAAACFFFFLQKITMQQPGSVHPTRSSFVIQG